MGSITLSKNGVLVKIQTHPFSMVVCRNNTPILRRLSSEFDIEYKGAFLDFKPLILKKSSDAIVLKHRDFELYLKLSIGDGMLKVEWDSKETLDSVTDVWAAVGDKEWYGQGQLRFQVYPLSNHFTVMRPFLANNIQVPFWVNRNGGAILVDTYELFESYFGNSLVIRGLYTSSFSYHVIVGRDISDARKRFLKKVGLPERMPDKRILAKPVFSTWVEYKKDIDESKILEFAKEIKEHDFPCSVVEIDDKWEKNYGDFTFDPERFPDPKGMIKSIHDMGYLVTLWVYPFINFESKNYAYAKAKGYLVLDPEKNEPAKVRWWNGEGGLLDISNPQARNWFNSLLESLKKLGIDGFKFDAGDGYFFPIVRTERGIKLGRTYGNLTPNKYTDEWLRFIAENQYNLAEARVGFLAQRYGVIAREGDKESTWGLDNGLRAAITQALTLSITGYPYIMPDMIGGNQYCFKCDKELFIRWVEATVLMPIVQYSITPWSFDQETVEISRNYTLLHLTLADYYVSLAQAAMRDGEPIICPLTLRYPQDDDCANIDDEYLVGNLLVAPVVERGREEREVYLPKGTWFDFWSGKEVKGPAEISVEAPLDRLPLYAEVHDSVLLSMIKRARKIFK